MTEKEETKTKKPRKSLLKRVPLSVVMLVFAMLGIISVAVAFINPSSVPFVGFLSLFYVPFLLINAALAVVGVFCRKKTTIMTIVTILLCSLFIPRYVQVRGRVPLPKSTPTTISVLSWNIGHFCALPFNGSKDEVKVRMERKEGAIAELRERDADIICLQECSAGTAQEICKALEGKYKIVDEALGDGIVIMSKLKAVGTGGRLNFEHSTNGASYADFNIAGKVLRIYNCHLESYGQSPYKILKSVFALEKHELEVKSQALQKSTAKRSVQIDDLCAHVAGCNKKNIVCGDFNDTPLSYTYSRIRRDHKDVFRVAGCGWGGTFRFMWPLVRIDYFFCSKALKPLYYDCLSDVEFSDHYPIMAYFEY